MSESVIYAGGTNNVLQREPPAHKEVRKEPDTEAGSEGLSKRWGPVNSGVPTS